MAGSSEGWRKRSIVRSRPRWGFKWIQSISKSWTRSFKWLYLYVCKQSDKRNSRNPTHGLCEFCAVIARGAIRTGLAESSHFERGGMHTACYSHDGKSSQFWMLQPSAAYNLPLRGSMPHGQLLRWCQGSHCGRGCLPAGAILCQRFVFLFVLAHHVHIINGTKKLTYKLLHGTCFSKAYKKCVQV